MRNKIVACALGLALCLSAPEAFAQSQAVQQSGTVTAGHGACWVYNGILQDCGTSTGANVLNTLGITANGGTPFCIQDTNTHTGPYRQFCIGINSSAATVSVTPYNGAGNTSLNFVVNGITYPFPGTAPCSGCGTAASYNVGTSGDTIPLNSGQNTYSGGTTFTGLPITATFIGSGTNANIGINQTATASSATIYDIGTQIAMTSNVGLGISGTDKIALTTSIIAGANSGPIYGFNSILQGYAGAGGTLIGGGEMDIENVDAAAGTIGSSTAAYGWQAVSAGSASSTAGFLAAGSGPGFTYGFAVANTAAVGFEDVGTSIKGLDLQNATLSLCAVCAPNLYGWEQSDTSGTLHQILTLDGSNIIQIGYAGGTTNLNGTIIFPAGTAGVGTQTFTNSPCTTSLTAEIWIPINITGQSGTFYVPACH